FFFSSRRRHTRSKRDWSSDVCSSDLAALTDAHRFGPDVVLTPHRGEAERLATRLHLDPELPGALLAPALARATGATVLLKGAVKIGRASCREREENCWVCVS